MVSRKHRTLLHAEASGVTPPCLLQAGHYWAQPDVVAASNWERALRRRRSHCSWIAPAQRAETDAFYTVGASWCEASLETTATPGRKVRGGR